MLKFLCTLICSIFLLSATHLHGQLDADSAIKIVQEEGLVIRLNCNKAKLDTLQQIIKRGKISASTHASLQREYEKTKKEFTEKNQAIIKEFSKNYRFGKVHFIPDSLFKDFVAGQRENIFLNQEMEFYSDTNVPEHFVFGYFDYNMKLNSIKLRHSEFKPEVADYKMITGNFPKEVKASAGFGGLLKAVFTLGIHWKDNLSRLSKELNKHMHKLN